MQIFFEMDAFQYTIKVLHNCNHLVIAKDGGIITILKRKNKFLVVHPPAAIANRNSRLLSGLWPPRFTSIHLVDPLNLLLRTLYVYTISSP